ncbi:aldehyde dehydrogenase family protein [Enterobacteriaceae bacterium 4M9]|nr:aldehyde dehydrogenase family protein [Enterobacteriaceae bacterium 4M9]
MSVIYSGISGEELAQQSIIVRNPWNDEIITEIAIDSRERVQQKLSAAWSFRPRLTREARREVLSRARSLLGQRKLALARLASTESGLSLQDTLREVDSLGTQLDIASEAALFSPVTVGSYSEASLSDAPQVLSLRSALNGVIAVITSFNHPLSQVLDKVALAIATNNRIVLKPSSKTPLCARALHALLVEAGMPEQMFTLVNCSDSLFADIAAHHHGVDRVSFSGSRAAAREIAFRVPSQRLVMDLSSNDALIVCADTDLKAAAGVTARGAFSHSGQAHGAVKWVLVERRCHDEFVRHLVNEARQWRNGDPLDPQASIGTLIDAASAAEIEQRIAISLALGATCVAGNQRQGASLSATVLTRVTPDMPVVTRETFGPVAPVMAFTDIDDAIELARNTRPGLNASLLTQDKALLARYPRAPAYASRQTSAFHSPLPF